MAAESASVSLPQPRLLDRVRHKIRLKHYSIRTKKANVDSVRRHIHFHSLRHLKDLGAQAVDGLLTHPAFQGNMPEATQPWAP